MKRNIFYVVTTILLLLLIIFFSRETVYAQREGRIAVDSEVQKQIEKEYVEQVKEILDGHHLSNSGVMMTKVIYVDGRREYTVKINNRVIQQMTSYEQAHLKTEMEKISFPLPNCSFTYEYLELQ
ncbi:MAG: hypothetical protein IIV45_09615 [Lachnospiraceae bacterium]|nr:hypothetical protein [Lachnospiraceae bacterium]